MQIAMKRDEKPVLPLRFESSPPPVTENAITKARCLI
jgi:hypothetical protein